MANRVIRDWTTSEKIDSLPEMAELFFVRLIMKADDHGCFHANPKLLKAALFPLRDYTDSLMETCLRDLEERGILTTYEVEGRKYLKINDFGQRLRNMVSKFPQPADNPPTNVSNPPPETKRNEVEKKWKSAKEAFGEITSDEITFEAYERQLNGLGFMADTNNHTRKLLRHFLNKQNLDADYWHKEKSEIKRHFSNWIDSQGKKRITELVQ